MPTRITRRDKWLDGQQVLEEEGLIASLASNPKASYAGRNQELRILCGSF
jgi:hypothetical protein